MNTKILVNSASAKEAAKRTKIKTGYVLGIFLAVSTLNYIDRQIVNILAEPIKEDLGLADWQLGALTGLSFAIFYSVLGLPIARLADRFNRPVIIGASLMIWSAFTALCGLATTYTQLLLARIGVGCGEAGGTPPMHSLISDFTTPQNRASALAVVSLGGPLGTLIALASGAWLAQNFGWRTAFLVAAAPGILIAILIILAVKEPRRLRVGASPPTISLREVWQELRGKRTFWWICLAATATAIANYGQATFWGSFFLRVHGAEITELYPEFGQLSVVGLMLGLVQGVAGMLGVYAGGWLTDRFAKRDLRAYCTVPAVALALASPMFVVVLFASAFLIAALALTAPVFLGGIIFGPLYAANQSLVRPETRATASAIQIFIITIIGLGLGPLAIGAFSDLFARSIGMAEGLRWALLLTAPANLISALCFWKARETILFDLHQDQA